MNQSQLPLELAIHCRIGSSEIVPLMVFHVPGIHCRIGSSEKLDRRGTKGIPHSLPHRQLRKTTTARCAFLSNSLPHRQLRKRPVMPAGSLRIFTAA